jgi:hypothetical protein
MILVLRSTSRFISANRSAMPRMKHRHVEIRILVRIAACSCAVQHHAIEPLALHIIQRGAAAFEDRVINGGGYTR